RADLYPNAFRCIPAAGSAATADMRVSAVQRVRRGSMPQRGYPGFAENQLRPTVSDLRQRQELIDDQRLQLGAVRHCDVDEVVIATADVVKGKRLRQREGLLHEVVGRVAGVRADLDAEESLLALAEQARGYMCARGDDGAVATHPPDALQAGARSHADF